MGWVCLATSTRTTLGRLVCFSSMLSGNFLLHLRWSLSLRRLPGGTRANVCRLLMATGFYSFRQSCAESSSRINFLLSFFAQSLLRYRLLRRLRGPDKLVRARLHQEQDLRAPHDPPHQRQPQHRRLLQGRGPAGQRSCSKELCCLHPLSPCFSFRGSIRFNNAHSYYPRRPQGPVLSGLSFGLNPGKGLNLNEFGLNPGLKLG